MPSFVDVLTQTDESDDLRLLLLCIQIENIVLSYDDRLDAFAELLQNAADAVIQRWEEEGEFEPEIRIHIDCGHSRLTVLDNGIGVQPEDFYSVFQPNFSLKRRLGHSQARGEKGAGVVFLQFGHARYGFSTKVDDFKKTFEVVDGERWFEESLAVLQDESLNWEQKQTRLPNDPHDESDEVSAALDSQDRGSESFVEFSGRPSHPHVDQIFADPASALNRLEALCRTRTAVGYFSPPGGAGGVHPALTALTVKGRVTFPDGTESDWKDFERGFLYPT